MHERHRPLGPSPGATQTAAEFRCISPDPEADALDALLARVAEGEVGAFAAFYDDTQSMCLWCRASGVA